MNKKGQALEIVVGIVILGGIILAILSWNVSFQSGTSKDKVMGYDVGPIWNHAYLVNDHHTVYCFDDNRFNSIFDEAQRTQKEVIVSYKKYAGRGALCTTSETYEKVIVTNVEIIN